jgi:hypothetical protein
MVYSRTGAEMWLPVWVWGPGPLSTPHGEYATCRISGMRAFQQETVFPALSRLTNVVCSQPGAQTWLPVWVWGPGRAVGARTNEYATW